MKQFIQWFFAYFFFFFQTRLRTGIFARLSLHTTHWPPPRLRIFALRGLTAPLLKITGLPTMEARRKRGDLIEVFKILKGFSKVDYKHYFQLVNSSKTRGNKYKLVKSRSRLDIRKHFFSQRVVNGWNKLPDSVVEAESVNSFRNKYDSYVRLQRSDKL